MVRKSPDYNNTEILTAETIRCLNLGSYNYLGFGDPVPRYPTGLREAHELDTARRELSAPSSRRPTTALLPTGLLAALRASYIVALSDADTSPRCSPGSTPTASQPPHRARSSAPPGCPPPCMRQACSLRTSAPPHEIMRSDIRLLSLRPGARGAGGADCALRWKGGRAGFRHGVLPGPSRGHTFHLL